MIARNYDEWRECIEVRCKIKLTKSFAENRLAVYQDKNNPETNKFIALYGEQHHSNIVHWLKMV